MYVLKNRVCASRTDANGKMKLAGAIEVIQDCSMLWMESEPSFQNYLAASNLGMFLASRQADIVRMPEYGEQITVKTSIFDCNRFFGYRNTVLYGGDGTPCLLTWCIGAFVNMDTGKMARLPQNELNKVTLDEKIDMEYLDRKIAVPELPGQRLAPFAVRRSDIDLNRHMNNAKYIEAALEFLPADFKIRRLRVEYKMPAKLGDQLYPKRIQAPAGDWYILLLDSRDNPFAVVEFS